MTISSVSGTSVSATATVNVISTDKFCAYMEDIKRLAAVATPGESFDGSPQAILNVLSKVEKQCAKFIAHQREEALRAIRTKCEDVINLARATRQRALAAWQASEDMQAAMPSFGSETHIRLLAKNFAPCMSDTLTFQQVCNNLTNMGYDVSVPDGRKKGSQDPYIIVPIAAK